MWKFSTRYSARSLSFSLTLFFSRCRAVFSCCRCLRTTTNNFVENFVSHFSSSSARFLMCVFSFCLLHLLLHLFFCALFGFYHVVGNYALCEIQRTKNFWATTSSSECISCNALRPREVAWGGMASKLPNLRQQQVDLTSTWKKELRIHRAAGNRTLRSLSFATSTISRQLARQYVLLVGANFWVIFIH